MFEQQNEKYQKRILPSGNLVIAIEAAVGMGWEKWLHAGQRKSLDKVQDYFTHILGITSTEAATQHRLLPITTKCDIEWCAMQMHVNPLSECPSIRLLIDSYHIHNVKIPREREFVRHCR